MHAETRLRVLLVVCSVLFSLAVLELGLRARLGLGHLLDWSNAFAPSRQRDDPSTYYIIHHPVQGFVPRPGYASPAINHDADGFRVTPGTPKWTDKTVLAVGDSFTFGADVADRETWPTYLQADVGRRIVNGGVPGYGLDQMVLQAERVVPAVRPDILVVSFIADDLDRMEMSRVWGVEKPYFLLQDGKLVLQRQPVPPSPPPGSTYSAWHRMFGWSYLVAAVEKRVLLDRHEWIGDSVRAQPRGAGEGMVCPLLARLAGVGRPTLVVAQYDQAVWQDAGYSREARRLSRRVLDCAASTGFATLDLFADTDRAVRTLGYDAVYFGMHHTGEGNRVAARAIAAELRRLGWLPPP